MQVNVYSIYDRVAREYGPPFCAKNHGVAMRMYADAVKQATGDAKDDYEIWKIGSYDTSTGILEGNIERFMVDYQNMKEEVE